MNDTMLSSAGVLHDQEADAIDAIKAALVSAEKKRDESAIRSLRDQLSDARIRRIGRLSDETWDALERLVGHRLRR